ncbi:DUF1697 domain-containing protein [Persicobacter diffluens]
MEKSYIAILRGINVSGKNIIPMAELRRLLAKLGLKNCATYIQSGNVLFDSTLDAKTLESLIAREIAKVFGYDVPCQVFAKEDWKMMVQANPYLGNAAYETSFFHLTFLADLPEEQLFQSIGEYNHDLDEFKKIGRVIYLYCPGGYGRTKLNNSFWEKKLGVSCTTRNWKTVQRLAQ